MTKIYVVLFSFAILLSSVVCAQSPIFPYYEAFDSYTANQPLNGNGGIVATSHVYVMPRGVVGNCAEFQMAPGATHDTLTSPLIGPLTSHSITIFYFRAVTYTGGTPSHYTMTTGDQAQVIVGTAGFALSQVAYTINSSNQNPTSSYIKVVVPIPALLAGNSGGFKIVTQNTSGHNWLMEFDSLVVMDTVHILPVLRDSITNVKCRPDSTGSMTVFASGATPPYTYVWSTGETTPYITQKAAGVYRVTVTDSLGVTQVLSDTIKQPARQLQLDSLVRSNVKCFGAATGSAKAYPSGGTPNYTYHWSITPTQTTQQATNMPAGNYGVTVTDNGGCTVTAQAVIAQPATYTLQLSSTASSGTDGTATAAVSGGTPPYTYLWTPTSETTATATTLPPGEYYVTVTDSNLCTLTDSVLVRHPNGINEADSKALKLYPNPASNALYISVDGINHASMSVIISDMSGRVVLTDDVVSDHVNISTLMSGVYVVKVNSGNKSYFKRMVIER